MRVIAGIAKGHPLKAPKGMRTRPTSDLVRGAIFSMLEALPIDWNRVLDLYAGTGAMGIESLSRGAEEADFVEVNSSACAVIKDNLQTTKFLDKAHVFCTTVEKAMSFLNGPYDIIFLDPPYADTGAARAFEVLSNSGLVGGQTVVVLEHSNRASYPSTVGKLELIKDRRHGDTRVSIYKQED